MIRLKSLIREEASIDPGAFQKIKSMADRGHEWGAKAITARYLLKDQKLADAYTHLGDLIATGALPSWGKDLRQAIVSLDHDLMNKLVNRFPKEEFDRLWSVLT